MPAVIFRAEDMHNIELVRQIVLRRLKEDRSWQQFYETWRDPRVSAIVEFENPGLIDSFLVLENEVLWQLIIQGIITPGMNSSNPALPWFRITDYGKRVLAEEKFIPHDPTGYLESLRDIAEQTVGEVSLAYVGEALRCFTTGCNTACVLLLGIAAEATFLELCKAIRSNLTEAQKPKLGDNVPVRQKHRWILKKFEALSSTQRRSLPETMDTTLYGLHDLIRRERNEIGHPQSSPPDLTRDDAFMFLRVFPTYVRDMDKLTHYCQENGF